MLRTSAQAVATLAMCLTSVIAAPAMTANAADGSSTSASSRPSGAQSDGLPSTTSGTMSGTMAVTQTDGLTAGAAAVGARASCRGPVIVCPAKFMFGASTPRVLTLNSTLTKFEAAAGRKADIIGSYQDFTEPFYGARLKAAIASGRTPLVTWEPFNARKGTKATYPLAKIAAGAYDKYLKKSALQAKAVGKPFIVRFGHEMNGFWYPWGMARSLHPQSIADRHNTPAAYVKAYRHVVAVFRALKVTNVAWMWSPNVTDANPAIKLASLYPGDAYVDAIGISGYLDRPSATFESRFRPTLTELGTIGGTKPIIIAETGVMPSANRAAALTQALDGMSSEPRVTGLLYFAQPDKSIEYRLTGDAVATAALKAAVARPRFRLATTTGAAFAVTPIITGNPRVGSTLTATYRWRGAPTAVSASWLSCPAADSAVADCTRVGDGTTLRVLPEHHGRYLRADLGVVSTRVIDHAQRTVGPVLTTPDAVIPTAVEMLTGALKVHLPVAQAQTSHFVLGINGEKTYLTPATTEHFFGSLTAGSPITLTVGALDAPAVGPVTTYSFTLLAKPAAPTFATSAGSVTATLPEPAAGQTGWIFVVDNVGEDLPLNIPTVTKNVSAGSHKFGLRAVSGIGRTNPVDTTVTVP